MRFNTRTAWVGALALLFAVASPALAGRRTHSVSSWASEDGGGDGSFSAANLNGPYVLEASGFADDGKGGEVSVLGTLNFDGTSAVTGNLIFTRGDNAQFSCNDSFSNGGSYTFTGNGSAPGTYSMVIPLTGGSNTGTLNFGILVPSADGNSGRVIETDNGSLVNVEICGTPLVTSMVLHGTLRALEQDD